MHAMHCLNAVRDEQIILFYETSSPKSQMLFPSPKLKKNIFSEWLGINNLQMSYFLYGC